MTSVPKCLQGFISTPECLTSFISLNGNYLPYDIIININILRNDQKQLLFSHENTFPYFQKHAKNGCKDYQAGRPYGCKKLESIGVDRSDHAFNIVSMKA